MFKAEIPVEGQICSDEECSRPAATGYLRGEDEEVYDCETHGKIKYEHGTVDWLLGEVWMVEGWLEQVKAYKDIEPEGDLKNLLLLRNPQNTDIGTPIPYKEYQLITLESLHAALETAVGLAQEKIDRWETELKESA